MGTSLTGLTPATTYDALIKVGDNGPLSATAKILSDGLGNDSVLALSTARVGVGTTSPSYPLGIVGDTALEGNENYLYFHSTYSIGNNARARMRSVGAGGGSGYGGDFRIDTRASNNTWNADAFTINSAGNVGIGTTTPVCKLDVGGDSPQIAINRSSGNQPKLSFALSGTEYGSIVSSGATGENRFSIGPSIGWGGHHTFYTNTFERFRITDNGVTFNGDTSAANALDDYEEGTWTPVLSGSGTAGTYELGTTYGNYTKIGRQVTLNAVITLSSSITGGGTGYLQITGLPFTKSTNQEALGSCWFANVDFIGSFVVPRFVATTATATLYFIETVDNSSPIDLPISAISANDILNLSITYFV